MPNVVVKTGPLAGRRITVDKEMILGREGTDVVFEDDGEISRRHAALRPAGGGIEVEDLGSTNGTFVNDRRIESSTDLSAGDSVRIGKTTMEVEAAPGAADTIVSDIPEEIRRRRVGPPAPQVASSQDDAPTASLPEKELKRRREASSPSGRSRAPWLAAGLLITLGVVAYLLFFRGDDFASAADEACASHARRVGQLELDRKAQADFRRLHRIRASALDELRALDRPDEAGEYFTAFAATQKAIARLARPPGPVGSERAFSSAARAERNAARDLELDSCAQLTGL
ncbi:MAG: FHA domain-containing protein [Actinomycetota bacterium]